MGFHRLKRSPRLWQTRARLSTRLRCSGRPASGTGAASCSNAAACGSIPVSCARMAPTAAGQGAGEPGVQEQQAPAPRQHVFDGAGVFAGARRSGPSPRSGRPPSSRSAPGSAAHRRPPRCHTNAGPGAALMRGAAPGTASPPTKRQVGGHSGRARSSKGLSEAFFQHVLGHRPVGGPLAAGHRDQAAAADQHRVFAAERLGVVAVFALRLDQRPQADPQAADVGRAAAPASDSAPTRSG